MKNLFAMMLGILALLLVFSTKSDAGTCSSISRSNFSPNTVLTASELNNQFNTVYGAANALDGGCVSDGTLEVAAADSSWSPLIKYIKAGCKVSYSNASTLSISRCHMGVDDSLVDKSTATTVSFGCGSCSSETSETTFYVYAQDGSTGSTLTPLILTTAPNEDGYDNSNNRVLARFYNNISGDIDQYSIDQWKENGFSPQQTGPVEYTPSFSTAFGTPSNINFTFERIGTSALIDGRVTSGTAGAGVATVTLPVGMISADITPGGYYRFCGNYGQDVTTSIVYPTLWTGDSRFIYVGDPGGSNGAVQPNAGAPFGSSQQVVYRCLLPIKGWLGE